MMDSLERLRSIPREPITRSKAQQWTVAEVGDWLESIGMSQYRSSFKKKGVDGETLLNVTGKDLARLGVKDMHAQTHLIKAILGIPENAPREQFSMLSWSAAETTKVYCERVCVYECE